jgi:hypothetical protein
MKSASFCLAEIDFWQLGTSFFNPPWFCRASHPTFLCFFNPPRFCRASHPTFVVLSSLFSRLVVLHLVVCVVVLLVFLLSLLVVAQQTPCCLLKLWLLQTTRKGLHPPPPLQSLKGLPRPLPLPLQKRALERNQSQSLCHLMAFLHQSEPRFRLEQRSYLMTAFMLGNVQPK